jgi:hypothetical protein
MFKTLCVGTVLMALLLGAAPNTRAQTQSHLTLLEDSLKKLGNTFINDPNELTRKNANYTFIKTLVSALKNNDSYHDAFDSLKCISLIKAPDDAFRIFTWHVMNNDGSYRYYGAIQLNSASLKLFPLEDYSPFVKNPQDTVTDNRRWYGAQYYHIIKVSAPQPYYVLLGWKGNTVKTTKKVIEALSLNNGTPSFGRPVFIAGGKASNRIVFEYTRQASMLLRAVANGTEIVFDHLAPPEPKFKGRFDTYGPDLSYSAYKLKNGVWDYVDEIDLRNEVSQEDANYINPKEAATNTGKKQ